MGEGREESSSKTITQDDGGALAPLPPVSLSLRLPPLHSRRGLRSQRRPVASLRPRRSRLRGRSAAFSVSVRLAVPAAPGAGEATAPSPANTAVPGPRLPAAGPRGPARAEGAVARPAADARPLRQLLPEEDFVNLTKWRALQTCAARSAGPGGGGGGGGGGSSARRARTARPRVPAQTDRHSHARTLARAHAHSHTLSHSHRARPLAGGSSGTNSSSRNSSSSRSGGGGGARTPRSGCPLPEPDLSRDQQQRRQQSPRIPPPLLPPPPPPHSNGAFYYYSGGKRKGLKKNQPTKWRRTDPVAIATVNQNAKPRLTC